MDKTTFENTLNNDIKLIERNILSFLPDADDGQESVVNAIEYSILNGGKRIRPVLALEFAKSCGGDRHACIPLACAVEFIHTYSLIHDDLPCMDNDDMRRGKPSCHKQFDEATALLAGDALLTHAFSIISECDIDNDKKVLAISLLAQNSGVNGMIGGQVIDILYENGNPTVKNLLKMYNLKTGALISAACIMGCICAGADDEKIAAASKYALALGTAFQIQDDILDIVGDEAKLGKPVGSDAYNNKTTYATLVGIEKAKNDVAKLTEMAISALEPFDDSEFLKELALSLVNREN